MDLKRFLPFLLLCFSASVFAQGGSSPDPQRNHFCASKLQIAEPWPFGRRVKQRVWGTRPETLLVETFRKANDEGRLMVLREKISRLSRPLTVDEFLELVLLLESRSNQQEAVKIILEGIPVRESEFSGDMRKVEKMRSWARRLTLKHTLFRMTPHEVLRLAYENPSLLSFYYLNNPRALMSLSTDDRDRVTELLLKEKSIPHPVIQALTHIHGALDAHGEVHTQASQAAKMAFISDLMRKGVIKRKDRKETARLKRNLTHAPTQSVTDLLKNVSARDSKNPVANNLAIAELQNHIVRNWQNHSPREVLDIIHYLATELNASHAAASAQFYLDHVTDIDATTRARFERFLSHDSEEELTPVQRRDYDVADPT